MAGSRLKKRLLGSRRRIIIVVALAVAVFALASLGFVEYSSTPGFCNKCHIMKPYYESWRTSSHSFVPCAECHYNPGLSGHFRAKVKGISELVKYVTRTFGTKFHAEIDDASCLRSGCHSKRLLDGEVVFRENVVFDHKQHLEDLRRGKQLRCTSCHSQIVQGDHIAVTEETCFICHFKGRVEGREIDPITGCRGCHKILKDELDLDGTAFNHSDYPEADCVKCHFDVVEGDGAAISERCVTCHSEIERLARFNDIEFMHRTHVTDNKVECSGCHTPIKHEAKTRMAALEPACTVCHTAAHDAVHNMLLGKGGHDVKGEPAQMFLTRVSCVGCHVEPTAAGRDAHLSQEVTFRASGKGCADCHGEEFAELFEETKEYHSDMIASLDEEIASLEAALSDLPDGDLKNRCGELLGGAKHNRDFVVLGQAMHNTMYAGALLDKATEDIAQIKEMIASSSSEAEQDGG